MQSSKRNEKDEDIIILDDIDPLGGCEEPPLKIIRQSRPATAKATESTKIRITIPILKTQKNLTHQMRLPKLTPAQSEQFQTGKARNAVGIFSCKVCKTSLDEISEGKTNTKQVKLPYVCTKCKTLTNKKSIVPIRPIPTIDLNKNMKNSMEIFKCAVCLTIFKDLSVFRKHQKTHEGYSTSRIYVLD